MKFGPISLLTLNILHGKISNFQIMKNYFKNHGKYIKNRYEGTRYPGNFPQERWWAKFN